MPENWRDVLGDVAVTFHFGHEELWNMTIDDLLFWHSQARRLAEASKPR